MVTCCPKTGHYVQIGGAGKMVKSCIYSLTSCGHFHPLPSPSIFKPNILGLRLSLIGWPSLIPKSRSCHISAQKGDEEHKDERVCCKILVRI